MNTPHLALSASTQLLVKFRQLSRIWKIGLLGLICVSCVGLYLVFRPQTSPTSYQTAMVEKSTLVVSVSGTGQVTNNSTYQVKSTATGVVSDVYVQNNQIVKAGQPLLKITLDQTSQNAYTQAQSAYQIAKNSLAAAQTKQLTLQASMLTAWDSYKELAESDSYKDTGSDSRNLPEFVVPQRQWLAAEADYKTQADVINQSKLALQVASQNLAAASPTITAPIAGTISNLTWQKGAIVSSTSTTSSSTTTSSNTIALISTTAKPTVTVNLSEIDAPQVAIGNPATVTLTAYPDKTFIGSVTAIDILGSTSSGVTVYPVTITLEGELPNILPNMSAEASLITLTKNNVLSVPSSAIVTQNGTSTVKVLKNGQLTSVTVTTGITSDSGIEILTGLSEGDQIVTASTNTTPKSTTGGQTQSVFSSLGGNTFRGPR